MKKDKYNTLVSRLEGIAPTAYGRFVREQPTPYIIIETIGTINRGADNKVYDSCGEYRIGLYTDVKDFAKEGDLIDILSDLEIYWEKSGDIYIEKEDLHLVFFYI